MNNEIEPPEHQIPYFSSVKEGHDTKSGQDQDGKGNVFRRPAWAGELQITYGLHRRGPARNET